LRAAPRWCLLLGVKAILLAALLAGGCLAQEQPYELSGTIGYGVYRTATVYSPGGDATAGVRNRFVAGAVFSEDLYQHLSGEVRYLYQDGNPYVKSGGVLAQVQGQSHAINYDLLFHFRPRKERLRPYMAAGLGAKDYVLTGPEPFPQPFPNVATITNQDQWRLLYSAGFGVKYDLGRSVVLRFDFRDYLTPFPKQVIVPAPHGTARGIFEQFTPMFGVGYRF
jgi:opacity protein-like surface antigen